VEQVVAADISRMTDTLFVGPSWRSRSSSRFWVLLILAAVIASAGLVGDSVATVIGAMIVAPLMTPILGSALAVVLADRRHLAISASLVIAGACAVIAVGFLVSSITASPDAYANNSQVEARISPHLLDLLAALATGLVGAFALVRSDISDALPGVAIAISLVPPLADVGLLLDVNRYADAAQAALLFGTNVAAIVATGTAVFLLFGSRKAARAAGLHVGRLRGWTLGVVVVMVLAVAVPLTIGTLSVARDQRLSSKAKPFAEAWAHSGGWQIVSFTVVDNVVEITALGPPPDVEPTTLRRVLDAHGMGGAGLDVHLVIGGTLHCPAGGDSCQTSVQPG
jgi:uncharacterized hydrophobic protein (TIGR00271 family)